MVLDAVLLSTQHYKLMIKGKVDQSIEWSSALGVVAIEKGAFRSPSTKVAKFTFPFFRYEGNSINKVTFAKEVENKYYLLFHLFQGEHL